MLFSWFVVRIDIHIEKNQRWKYASSSWCPGRWYVQSKFNLQMHHWLVVWTPLKNDGVRQLGLFFPIYGKTKIHVPNHQPGIRWTSGSTNQGAENESQDYGRVPGFAVEAVGLTRIIGFVRLSSQSPNQLQRFKLNGEPSIYANMHANNSKFIYDFK